MKCITDRSVTMFIVRAVEKTNYIINLLYFIEVKFFLESDLEI